MLIKLREAYYKGDINFFWKNYLETKDNKEPISIVMHPWKIINTVYKNHMDKAIVMIVFRDFTLPMSKPRVKLLAKTLKHK